jgi:predicted DNA-binding transcriptional regulator AlpA
VSDLDSFVDELVTVIADRVVEQIVPMLVEGKTTNPWHLIDVDAVGAMLGRSRRTIFTLIRTAGLPTVHIDGGKVMFSPEAVRAWAEARQVPAREPAGDRPPLDRPLRGSKTPRLPGERRAAARPSSTLTEGSLR